MHIQTDINTKMRCVLVNWLLGVAKGFKVDFETVRLTIEILDRTIKKMHIYRKLFQLVGTVCLMISVKITSSIDSSIPELDEFVHVCGGAYTAKEIRALEETIVQLHKFDLFPACAPTGEFISKSVDLMYTVLFFSDQCSQHDPEVVALSFAQLHAGVQLSTAFLTHWRALFARHRLDNGVAVWHSIDTLLKVDKLVLLK